MEYVTVDGFILRTGYHDKSDWYLLMVKEKFDNCTDFLWKKYQGSTDPNDTVITADLAIDDSLFHCKVRNTNNKNFFVFQDLDLILNFNMTYGSKQNEHIISRGMLGDALKQIAAWPYVLIHTKDDGTTFVDKQWDYPLIVRNNRMERQIITHIDKANQIIDPRITLPYNHILHTDTEIESTWPIIDEVRNKLNADNIWRYCLKYTIFTTDISFKILLVDNSSTKSVPPKVMKIDIPALHSISPKWINKSTIRSYTPEEFVTKIIGIHDKQGTKVYDVLTGFKEGTQLKKTTDTDISIADFIKEPDYGKKIESLYFQLWEIAKSFDKADKDNDNGKCIKKLSLPYSHIKPEERKQALANRIAVIYPEGYLDTTKAVYRIFHDDVKKSNDSFDSIECAFEIIAIPVNEKLLITDPNYRTEFIGAVNYSLSPKGNRFEGIYEWNKKKDNLYPTHAYDIHDILREYGFPFHGQPYPKNKLPCIIVANLISKKFYYQGKDKARIDTSPFAQTIIKAVKTIADNIETFRAAGIELPTDYHINISKKPSSIPREDRKTTYDIVKELLLPRIQEVKAGIKITSEQTQDSLWYNSLPLFEKYETTRKKHL